MDTTIKTKLLRIIQFALMEFGHKDSWMSVLVLQLLEREHIKHEKRWLKEQQIEGAK